MKVIGKDIEITQGDANLNIRDPHRIYTWVARHGKDKLALFLYQGGIYRRDDREVRDVLRDSNRVRQASHEDLARINMVEQFCHPFPDPRFINKEVITNLVMDGPLYRLEDRVAFPIYSPTRRVATANMSPSLYLNTIISLIQDGREFVEQDEHSFTEDI